MHYVIRSTQTPPLDGNWSHPAWSIADTVRVDQFHPRSSDHRPRTEARVLHDADRLYIFFRVSDRFVRAQPRPYQGSVCQDSCVEFFVQPTPVEGGAKGYFNFEVNCGGVLLLHYVADAAKGPAGHVEVPEAQVAGVKIHHSQPRVVEPEVAGPVEWTIAYPIPFAFFEPYVGPVAHQPGAQWRANFYKCGDQTSHPHWASWSPVGERLSFHQPNRFGILEFA